MKPDTPAAAVQWGTMPRQQTVTGTISDLPQRVADAGITAPAITIVGRVVTLRPVMNWFEDRPLFGQTIIVTRTRQQASELAIQLEELGANIIEAPTIELVEPKDWTPVDAAMTRSGEYDWIIFTSTNGVRFTRDRLRFLARDVRAFGTAKIAAIGDATADAIRNDLSLHVDLCPESFVAEALANELAQRGQIAGKRFLLLRADIARPILREKLQQGGALEVNDVAIYQTQPAKSLPVGLVESLSANQVQWITFASSSTATNFIKLLGDDFARLLSNVKLASIGPITTQTLKSLNLTPTVQAETFNIDGLIEAISSKSSG
jgi:uroporphyrinogen III methyltransferase/synthase